MQTYHLQIDAVASDTLNLDCQQVTDLIEAVLKTPGLRVTSVTTYKVAAKNILTKRVRVVKENLQHST